MRAARPARGAAAAARPVDLRRHIGRLGARFDGRLRVVAVDRRRGSRVVFGAPGAPAATVADAVLASCSVPWLFPPVEIGGREYVDGGVWSLSNLDVAPAGRGSRGARAAADLRPRRRAAVPLALAPRAPGRPAALAELQVLRARGASGADRRARTRASIEAMGPNLMDAPGARAGGVVGAQARGAGGARPRLSRPRHGRVPVDGRC